MRYAVYTLTYRLPLTYLIDPTEFTEEAMMRELLDPEFVTDALGGEDYAVSLEIVEGGEASTDTLELGEGEG